MDRFDQPEEGFSAELDRLESILAQKDAEIRRLKSELELRDLYLEELHTALEAQAGELTGLDEHLRRLEPRGATLPPRKMLRPLLNRQRKTQS